MTEHINQANEQALRVLGKEAFLFHQGNSHDAHDYLGVHREGSKAVFRVWAPHADAVFVCGDFNAWSPDATPMRRLSPLGVWEANVPSPTVFNGQRYKYRICNGEQVLLKADPYAVQMQAPPDTASEVAEVSDFCWHDSGWMQYRKRYCREQVLRAPLNIYELHVGSWKRHEDGTPYRYSELADDLVHYVKQMGYTHVELMPIAEHPFEGSWGYQICGHFAPSARYGTPAELMRLIDVMHEAGIGVILDWVPGHFPRDAHGLANFDGQSLYEYPDPERGEHPTWGTKCFDLGCREVQSFLISNACYWAEYFHVDGLRVDAVSSMLYLDFDRPADGWRPNRHGGNENTDAIAFLKKLNYVMVREHPDVMMIAEESTAYPGVTDPAGLGFTLKWNMGWMNDTLAYLQEDPLFRRHHHHKLTFPSSYAYGEAYVLPISHDEVVHGKRSLIGRSPCEYRKKFADLRTYLAYMMTHPGKKLLFMGCEYGQFREWDHSRSLEWFLLDFETHATLQRYVAELNHFYLSNPALWELDGAREGFSWIEPDNVPQSIYSYRRRDAAGNELTVLLNFTPVAHEDFLLAVSEPGSYREAFSTDTAAFGGEGCTNPGVYRTESCYLREYRQAIRIKVPPLGAAIFCRIKEQNEK